MPEYRDIESAFEYVGSASSGKTGCVRQNHAVLLRIGFARRKNPETSTGQAVEFPQKRSYLAVSSYLIRPQSSLMNKNCVSDIQRRGAYGRFKDLLERRNLLEQWYAFEQSAQRRAIEHWCEENSLEITRHEG